MEEMSKATERTFRAISAPVNAHLFTVESALAAFAHIDAEGVGLVINGGGSGCSAREGWDD